MSALRTARGIGAFAATAWGATLVYAVLAVVLTWPLAPRAARDVPGDLLDPLFSCWALGWNWHAMGLSPGGPPPSYWDANIFHPTPAALARSEHFFPQALQGAPVYALTRSVLLTYNVLVLSTFVLSGLFLFLLARDETGDAWAALAAGLLYAFALVRWTQLAHLGGLSSQWMPLALLLARRVARADSPPWTVAGWTLALGLVTALQVTSSGYYLLFFPPFLALWAMVEAARAGGRGPWLRLAAAAAVAVALALPLVLPLLALHAVGAQRDLASVVDHSADLLSWVTAPEVTRLWGRLLDAFPRGEARLFPGFAALTLAGAGAVGAWRATRREGVAPEGNRRLLVAAAALLAFGVLSAIAALGGGWFARVGSVDVRVVGMTRAALLLAAGLALALAASRELRRRLRALAGRPETAPALLAALAIWLSLGPLVTLRGWPVPLPAAYRLLYDHVPGFSSGRAPARFAMVAACFGALLATWGLKHLSATPAGRRLSWALIVLFLAETAAMPLPLSRQWRMGDTDETPGPPEWARGPSPIVDAIRALPEDAVLAVIPFGEPFHEARAMFDSTAHWRRLLNGYSSWSPAEYSANVMAFRDPLRRAAEVLDAMRRAGATHVVVDEAAWREPKGRRIVERLTDAGARPVAHAGDSTLLALR